MGDAQSARSERERFQAPFDVLIADGHRRFDAVDTALDEIAPQYRGRSEDRSYKQFIEALRLANGASRRRLAHIRDDFERTPEQAYSSAKSLIESFPAKQEKLVAALRSSRSEALEVFAQPFTRLAKALLSNVEVLFFGWALEAFELRIYDIDYAKEPSGSASSLRREFGNDIQFLQFLHPILRQPSLFQHAVFGHELGHPAIRMTPPEHLVAVLGSTATYPTFANVALDAARSAFGGEFDTGQNQRISRWFDEILCDMIGMRLFGPAFAVAYVEVTLINRFFEREEKHDFSRYPPAPLRYDFLKTELANYRFGTYEAGVRPILDRLMSGGYIGRRNAEDEIRGSTTVIAHAVDLFSEHCIPVLLKDQVLEPASLREEIEWIWPLMDMDIPPAEMLTVAQLDLPDDKSRLSEWSREFDWRSILNGVLLWLLDHEKMLGSANDRAKARGRAVRMATGAIEMAEFQRRARKLRSQFGPMEAEGPAS